MPGWAAEDGNRLEEIRPGMKALFISGYTDDAIVHHGILDPALIFSRSRFLSTR